MRCRLAPLTASSNENLLDNVYETSLKVANAQTPHDIAGGGLGWKPHIVVRDITKTHGGTVTIDFDSDVGTLD